MFTKQLLETLMYYGTFKIICNQRSRNANWTKSNVILRDCEGACFNVNLNLTGEDSPV